MIYLFLDETHRDLHKDLRFVASCVEFPQHRFNSSLDEARGLDSPGRRPRLLRIKDFIEKTKGRVLLAYADIDKSLIPPRKKDDEALPGVTRYNTLWGAVMTYAVAEMVAGLVRSGVPFTTVDIFYDTKSLTEEHREAIGYVIRGQVRELASNYIRHHIGVLRQKLRFRKIKSVAKPTLASSKTKYQIGTWLADRLCHYADDLIPTGDSGIISVRNCTSDVENILIKLEAEERNR
jgi:hypothetical protein